MIFLYLTDYFESLNAAGPGNEIKNDLVVE